MYKKNECMIEVNYISEKDMVKKTKEIIDSSIDFPKPWQKYNLGTDLKDYILVCDLKDVNSDDAKFLREKIIWKNKEESKYPFNLQFPVPINGNFLKAKYLLLYSNPGSERMVIPELSQKKLLKCYNLDLDAELVIPNKQWFNWYIGELDKFFICTHDQNESFDWDKFSSEFCFINYFAYPTKTNKFDFSVNELKIIKKLESTEFVKELVKIGMKAGKEIIIVRRSEGVWKNRDKKKGNIFKKLDFLYQKDEVKKAIDYYNKGKFEEAKIIFEIFSTKDKDAKEYLKRIENTKASTKNNAKKVMEARYSVASVKTPKKIT